MEVHGCQCPVQPGVVAVTAGTLPWPSLCQCEPPEWRGRSEEEMGLNVGKR